MTRAGSPACGLRNRRPPVVVMRYLANPFVRLLVRSKIAGRTGPLAVLTFDAHRSGRTLHIPVLLHPACPVAPGRTARNGQAVGSDRAVPQDSWLVFTDAAWAANFSTERPLTVRYHGDRYTGTGQVCTDPVETARALRAALDVIPGRQLGLAVSKGRRPTDHELAAIRTLIRICAVKTPR